MDAGREEAEGRKKKRKRFHVPADRKIRQTGKALFDWGTEGQIEFSYHLQLEKCPWRDHVTPNSTGKKDDPTPGEKGSGEYAREDETSRRPSKPVLSEKRVNGNAQKQRS